MLLGIPLNTMDKISDKAVICMLTMVNNNLFF